MITATGRQCLQYCRSGDRITLGFNRNHLPIIDTNSRIDEFIKKIVKEGLPSLKISHAVEVFGKTRIRYDYVQKKTVSLPSAVGDGSVIHLWCTADKIRPVELLQGVFDLGDELNGSNHIIWYCGQGMAGEIAEARLKIKGSGRLAELDGTYYPDAIKTRETIQKLSRPVDSGGDGRIREIVSREAYFYYEKKPQGCRSDSDSDWDKAQGVLFARIAMAMNLRRSCGEDCMDLQLSRRMVPDGVHRNAAADSESLLCILRELKGDDSIHLITPRISFDTYIHDVLGYSRRSETAGK